MAKSDFYITFEIEPVIKVVCVALDCANNLAQYNIGAYCNLKHISLDSHGKCNQFEILANTKAQSEE